MLTAGIGTLRGVVSRVGSADPQYADAARQVLALDKLPLGRVVNDETVTEIASVSPNSKNNRPVLPDWNATGRTTAARVSVVAMMATATCRAPKIEA